MTNDLDWVADVRRWLRAEALAKGVIAPRVDDAGRGDSADVGYEAADPWLQSRPWVDAQRAGALSLK